MQKKVLIIVGSHTDLPTLEKKELFKFLKDVGIVVELEVASAHRDPDEVRELATNAQEKGFGVIITAAGMSNALSGVVSSLTTLPVIGIPMGEKAVYPTVGMPPGTCVLTVDVDAGLNAAIGATKILAIDDNALRERMILWLELRNKEKKVAAAEAVKQIINN